MQITTFEHTFTCVQTEKEIETFFANYLKEGDCTLEFIHNKLPGYFSQLYTQLY